MSAGMGPEATERAQQIAEELDQFPPAHGLELEELAALEAQPCPRTFLGIACDLLEGHAGGHRHSDREHQSIYGWSDALSD